MAIEAPSERGGNTNPRIRDEGGGAPAQLSTSSDRIKIKHSERLIQRGHISVGWFGKKVLRMISAEGSPCAFPGDYGRSNFRLHVHVVDRNLDLYSVRPA